jgi:hypothetical protein
MGVTPPTRWPRLDLVERAGFWPSSLRRSSTEGSEGVNTMTRTMHDRVTRRRAERARDRGSRRAFSVIDAQRGLTARVGRDARVEADPAGPGDARDGYLARTYD